MYNSFTLIYGCVVVTICLFPGKVNDSGVMTEARKAWFNHHQPFEPQTTLSFLHSKHETLSHCWTKGANIKSTLGKRLVLAGYSPPPPPEIVCGNDFKTTSEIRFGINHKIPKEYMYNFTIHWCNCTTFDDDIGPTCNRFLKFWHSKQEPFTNTVSLLGQRRRRWISIETAFDECLVFAGDQSKSLNSFFWVP